MAGCFHLSSITRRVDDRKFNDGRVEIRAVMTKNTLAELARNGQVEIKSVGEVFS